MKLLIVTNRLPISVKSIEQPEFIKSPGGLVSGILSFLEKYKVEDYLWLGWIGANLKKKEVERLKVRLIDEWKSLPVYIPERLMDKFYNGFCNKTLWPLFHSMSPLAVYEKNHWASYVEVNKIFLQHVLKEIDNLRETYIWVHDYHLMILPYMLREISPDARIGFFLHIPFPPPEIFSQIPWRKEILEGLLGADLIGFHTYEYTVNFLRSLSKILGIEHTMGEIIYSNRVIKVDTFPMGINFELFNSQLEATTRAIEIKEALSNKKIIFSIDRLDYTKGIYNRLLAFEEFLNRRKDWIGKVVLLLHVVPSREGVEHYQRMKKQIEEKVSEINGKFGSVEWVPILYHYKSLGTEELIAHYRAADVMLVTPIKDGMNLVAKEFVASRNDLRGVLILSEFAGSSKELGEAILVNPNNIDDLSKAIEHALEMPKKEQESRLKYMRERLRRYNILKWGTDFIESFKTSIARRNALKTKELNERLIKKIKDLFISANKKLLLIDYDGTLVPLARKPDLAVPTPELKDILLKLTSIEGVSLVLISGRRRDYLEEWFGDIPIFLVAEHGCWIKTPLGEWTSASHIPIDIKEKVKTIMEVYTDRLPQSFVEEKDFGVAFHYRNSDPEMSTLRVAELVEEVGALVANTELNLSVGDKVVEVRPAGVNKGSTALKFCLDCDFILAVGDDITDEDLFRVLPQEAITIKVGLAYSYARYSLPSYKEVLKLLNYLGES